MAALQAAYFNDKEVKILQSSITPDVDAKLARIAASIPGLSAESRVLDAGAGEGALIPHLQVCLLPAQQLPLTLWNCCRGGVLVGQLSVGGHEP